MIKACTWRWVSILALVSMPLWQRSIRFLPGAIPVLLDQLDSPLLSYSCNLAPPRISGSLGWRCKVCGGINNLCPGLDDPLKVGDQKVTIPQHCISLGLMSHLRNRSTAPCEKERVACSNSFTKGILRKRRQPADNCETLVLLLLHSGWSS